MSFTLVRLPELIDRALELYVDQFDDRRVEVVREYAHDVPSIQADKDALYRVFVNLVANALDAMPRGGRLTVRAGWAGPGAPVRTADWRPPNRVKVETPDPRVGLAHSDTDRILHPP